MKSTAGLVVILVFLFVAATSRDKAGIIVAYVGGLAAIPMLVTLIRQIIRNEDL